MRSKLVLSTVAIILLVLTVLSSTFAAYYNGLTAYVGGADITLSSDNYTSMSIDGVNFSERLTAKDVYKGIIARFKGYTFNDQGNFLDGTKEIEATSELIEQEIKKITLSPVTTTDGKSFQNVSFNGAIEDVSVKRGTFISFDLYFKSNVDRKFDLYFNTDANNYDLDKNTVKITADDVNVNNANFSLNHSYNTYDELGNTVIHNKDDELKINPSDAVRFSTVVGEKTKIYEPNIGLGSVSTKLNSDAFDGEYRAYASRFDENKNAAVSYSKNGGATYESYSYNQMPVTYQGFDSVDALTIVGFEHKDQIKTVNFNFWLEGWDADCFEPIVGKQIRISLSFRGMEGISSYTINYHDGDMVKSVEYLKSNLLDTIPREILYKDGSKFLGWYLEDNETEFDFKPLEHVDQVLDVYAKWQNN